MSAIDPTVPVYGQPTTQSVRDNFAVAAGEITALEDAVAALSAILGDITDLPDALAGMLPLTGGTLTGPLMLAADPLDPLEAATRSYVDQEIALIPPPLPPDLSGYLPLAGGTMSGPLTLAHDPTEDFHAATKQYIDTSVATSLAYQGPWAVATNIPDLNAATVQGGFRWLCTTADPLVPETPPVPIPGLTGRNMTDGSFIIYDAALARFDVIAVGALTKADADSLYLSLGGGALAGPLTLAADPMTAMHAATKQYVDMAPPLGGPFLPLTGGTLAGPLEARDTLIARSTGATPPMVSAIGNSTSLLATPIVQLWNGSNGMMFRWLNSQGRIEPCDADGISTGDVWLNFANTNVTIGGVRPLILAVDPTAPMHAATRQYVDAADALAFPRTGGTLTGPLEAQNTLIARSTGAIPPVVSAIGDSTSLLATPTVQLWNGSNGMMFRWLNNVGRIEQCDAAGASTGDTWLSFNIANITVGGIRPLVLAVDPTTAMHAATKQYVDNAVAPIAALAARVAALEARIAA
jgi:hypothetical protein